MVLAPHAQEAWLHLQLRTASLCLDLLVELHVASGVREQLASQYERGFCWLRLCSKSHFLRALLCTRPATTHSCVCDG
jgi:hypothetical protein